MIWFFLYETIESNSLIQAVVNNGATLWPKSVSNLCDLLKENNIHYVQTEKEFEKDPVFNIDHDFYADHFDPVYDNPRSHLKEKVYSRDEICSKVN
jgi:hypothetical protein